MRRCGLSRSWQAQPQVCTVLGGGLAALRVAEYQDEYQDAAGVGVVGFTKVRLRT
jgi:hypothetical protein